MKNSNTMDSAAIPKRRINLRPLSQACLMQHLKYDPETGHFTWLRNGKIAGNTKPSGYITIQINKSVYYAHRLAWLYMTGSLPIMAIDHINRQKSDNRFGNLRVVTDSENQLNHADKDGNTRTGICASISWNRGRQRWHAYLKRDNKMMFSKRFLDFREAERALDEARGKFPPTSRPVFQPEKSRRPLAWATA